MRLTLLSANYVKLRVCVNSESTCDFTPEMLKSARTRMGLGVAEMAIYLGWAYRTYQDREAGVFAINQEAAAEVIAAEKRLSESMCSILKSIDVRIGKDFPNGIAF